MIVYGSGQSRSFRVVWALEEASLEYEYRKLQFGSKEQHGSLNSEYRKLNPQGKVPVLLDDEFVLTESAAIVNYIASLAPEKKLVVNDEVKLKARFDEFTYFIMTELEQPLWNNGKHRFALPKEQRVTAMLDTAKFEFQKALSALEKLFDPEDWEFAMSGRGADYFTIIDVLLAQTIQWAVRFEFEVPQTYIEYSERMFARDAAVKALALIQEMEA